MNPRRTHILCEGFTDRDFMSGYFQHVHGFQQGLPTHAPGVHLWKKNGGRRIAIHPVRGHPKLRPFLLSTVAQWDKCERVIVIRDRDNSGLSIRDVKDWLAEEFHVDDGLLANLKVGRECDTVWVSLGFWRGVDESDEMPKNHDLERVICEAIRTAHPNRYAALLRSLPEETGLDGKRLVHLYVSLFGPRKRISLTDFLRDWIWKDLELCQAVKAGVIHEADVLERLGSDEDDT